MTDLRTPEWRDSLPWCSIECPSFCTRVATTIGHMGEVLTGHGVCHETDRECDVAQLCVPEVAAEIAELWVAGNFGNLDRSELIALWPYLERFKDGGDLVAISSEGADNAD